MVNQREVSYRLCGGQREVRLWHGGDHREVSHWVSVESERVQSLACWKYQRKFSTCLEYGSERHQSVA